MSMEQTTSQSEEVVEQLEHCKKLYHKEKERNEILENDAYEEAYGELDL